MITQQKRSSGDRNNQLLNQRTQKKTEIACQSKQRTHSLKHVCRDSKTYSFVLCIVNVARQKVKQRTDSIIVFQLLFTHTMNL